MSKLIFVTLPCALFALSIFSHAADHPVAIQCNPMGPVSRGTLDFEPDVSLWKTAGECISYSGWSARELEIPFILRFQNLDYRPIGTVTAMFSSQACEFEGIIGIKSIKISEQTSHYGLFSSSIETVGKQLPKTLIFYYSEGLCTVHVLD